MFHPNREWIERDEEYHNEAVARFDAARRACLEGAPVPGEDGYDDFAHAAGLPLEADLEATRTAIENDILERMFNGKYD